MAAQMGFDSASGIIAAGASLSGAINLGAARVRGILMPSVWTAAALTFQASFDGVSFLELIDDRTGGYVYTTGFAVAVSQYLAIDPVLFDGVPIIKIRSGTLATPVNQVAQATLNLALRLV